MEDHQESVDLPAGLRRFRGFFQMSKVASETDEEGKR